MTDLFRRRGLSVYLWAVAAVAVASGVAAFLHELLPHANLSLVFLTAALVVAARLGLWPSMFAALLGFLAFNFFFTTPYYTLDVHDEGELATLLFFLAMAGLTGQLAARMRDEIANRERAVQRISRLYAFTRQLAAAGSDEEVLSALAEHAALAGIGWVVIYLPASPEHEELLHGDRVHLPVARRTWEADEGEPGGWSVVPLATARGRIGLLMVQRSLLEGDVRHMLRNLCDQSAVVLERIRLAAALEGERLVSETERLRSALLSSVSHDLRTPLASIIGAATSLIEYGESFSVENRNSLMRTVLDEAERLNRYIQNLLDMTRLGQGGLKLQRDWVEVSDLISSAVDRLRSGLEGVALEIDIAPGLPLLHIHGVLIEQALVNLVDNAVRFSPPGGRLVVRARPLGERLALEVIDQGPGIPPQERTKVFDMFYSVTQGDCGGRQGSGLGLAICQGMVVAHGGEVQVHDGEGGTGTCMRILLPVAAFDGDQEEVEA